MSIHDGGEEFCAGVLAGGDGGETVCYDGNEGTGAEGVGREDVFVVRALFQKLEVGRRVVLVVREA